MYILLMLLFKEVFTGGVNSVIPASGRKSFGNSAETQLSMLVDTGSLLHIVFGRVTRLKMWIPQGGQLLTACEPGWRQAAGP